MINWVLIWRGFVAEKRQRTMQVRKQRHTWMMGAFALCWSGLRTWLAVNCSLHLETTQHFLKERMKTWTQISCWLETRFPLNTPPCCTCRCLETKASGEIKVWTLFWQRGQNRKAILTLFSYPDVRVDACSQRISLSPAGLSACPNFCSTHHWQTVSLHILFPFIPHSQPACRQQHHRGMWKTSPSAFLFRRGKKEKLMGRSKGQRF